MLLSSPFILFSVWFLLLIKMQISVEGVKCYVCKNKAGSTGWCHKGDVDVKTDDGQNSCFIQRNTSVHDWFRNGFDMKDVEECVKDERCYCRGDLCNYQMCKCGKDGKPINCSGAKPMHDTAVKSASYYPFVVLILSIVFFLRLFSV